MLTADLVCARRRRGELELVSLSGKRRERALEIASDLVVAAAKHVGGTRADLREALSLLELGASEHRLAQGLAKLVEDACTWSSESALDPAELRRAVFEAASDTWRALSPGARFDREALLAEVARAYDAAPSDLDALLFADLRSAQRIVAFEPLSAEGLVERYEQAELQAVLLRAVRITADVTCSSPAGYRTLFGKLKFRRLLFRITPRESGFRIEIDGPYSLFESVTKYGLQLALVLPALQECDSLSLVAELRWGKQREALTFRLSGGTRRSRPAQAASDEATLSDELAALVAAFRALASTWSVEPTETILDVPGAGLCVPDLVFSERKSGVRVYFEALGYWSRDAVWRRVELVQAGLREPVLFAVSSRLRVSEEVLSDDESAALYVYKGALSARAVLRKLEALQGRAAQR